MDNYSFIQKLLLFNSISVIVTLILAIGPEIQLVQTHSASLIIQITIFIISILNWVLEKKYIFLNKDEELNHKFQKISIVIWILCFLLSTSDLYFRENNIDSLEFLSTLILISVQQEYVIKNMQQTSQQLFQVGVQLIISLNFLGLIINLMFQIRNLDKDSNIKIFKLRSCIISSILVLASQFFKTKFLLENESQKKDSNQFDLELQGQQRSIKLEPGKSTFHRFRNSKSSKSFSSKALDAYIPKEEELENQYYYTFTLKEYMSMNSKACLLVDKNFIILEFNQSFKEFFRSYQKVIEQENLSDFFSKFKVFSDSKIETITQGELKRGKSLNQTKRTNYFNILEAKHDTSFFKSDDLQHSSHFDLLHYNKPQIETHNLNSELKKLIKNSISKNLFNKRTSVRDDLENFNNTLQKIKAQINEKTYHIQIFQKTNGFDNEFLIVFEDISYKERQENKASNHSFKSKILHSFSHQLRTPLNYSIGVLQNFIQKLFSKIQYTSKKEEKRDFQQLTNVLYRNKHLLSIVNDIIDLGEQDSGNLSFHFEPFHLHQMVQGVLNYFQLSIEMKKLETKINIDNTVQQSIINDGKRLLQVLLNIIDNAIKFTQQGQITITITKSPQFDSKQELIQISIIDSGCGMAPEQLSFFVKLMNNLNIEDGVETQKNFINSKGFGLGLAISKYLIRGLNGGCGKIEIVSIEKVGTTFTFYIKDFKDSGFNGYKMRKKPILQLGDVYEFIPNIKQSPQMITRQPIGSIISFKESKFQNKTNKQIMDPNQYHSKSQIQMEAIQLKNATEKLEEQQIINQEENFQIQESKIFIHRPYESKNNYIMNKSPFYTQLDDSTSVSPIEKQNNNDYSPSRQNYFRRSLTFESQILPLSKILVVDDNQFNVQCMQIMLESEGLSSDCCFSGESALEMITEKLLQKKEIYSLIFMDIDMPGWDGFETAQNIHNFLNGHQILDSAYTICCCTAFTDDDSRVSAKASGMSLFISQPIDNNAIRKVIETIGQKKKRPSISNSSEKEQS